MACLSAYRRLVNLLGAQSARQEVLWMLQSLSTRARDKNNSTCQEPICPRHRSPLCDFIQRRSSNEPLQYILGDTPFGPLSIKSRRPVLIPRVETEDWAIRLANLLSSRLRTRSRLKVLDLCTGTGCIPLLLCHLLPSGSIDALAIDISEDACQLAQENAELAGYAVRVHHTSDIRSFPQNSVRIAQADMLNLSPQDILPDCARFDVITCNPPYVTSQQYSDLPQSVKEYEDPLALVGSFDHPQSPSPSASSGLPLPSARQVLDSDGLTYYRVLQKLIPRLLKPKDGILATEFGFAQAGSIQTILGRSGLFETFEIWKDPWGINRVAVGIT